MCEGGENCLKYLKRGWNRKEGRGNKGFKKGGQAGSRGGCLKKKGGWSPHTNYDERIDLLITDSVNIYQTKIPIVMKTCFT